ncbi:RlmF-related methyltransferase [Schleiferiaceae bacterium]|nr:RlmF-related methyltransferase [Schleiferiaceae bacterium]
MHQKNPFNTNYNFNQLINAVPELKECIVLGKFSRKSIDFSNSKAVYLLNKSLLKWRFNLNWSLKEGHLCPAVPGRLDYLLNVQDLIPQIEGRRIKMLDLGTGASLIYPLLATAAFNWECVGTEIDKEAITYAKGLIRMNSNMRGTKVRRQEFKSQLLKGIMQKDDQFDVLVCNPPFYKTKSEAFAANAKKNKNLHGNEKVAHNFGGSPNELWYKGGEEAFLKKLASESAEYKNQILWFTSLVSKKENLRTFKRYIRKENPTESI